LPAYWPDSAIWALSPKLRNRNGIAGCLSLGYEVPVSARPGISRAIYVGDPAKRPARPEPRSTPSFLRSQPGPDREYENYGAKLRVIAAEFYDTALAIRWRVSPPPDVASAFPDEAAALERDVIGLEEWAAEDLRKKGLQTLAMTRLYEFELRDDLEYRVTSWWWSQWNDWRSRVPGTTPRSVHASFFVARTRGADPRQLRRRSLPVFAAQNGPRTPDRRQLNPNRARLR
jgi:hypothetical protein